MTLLTDVKIGDIVTSPRGFRWTVADVQTDGQVRLAWRFGARQTWARQGDIVPEPYCRQS